MTHECSHVVYSSTKLNRNYLDNIILRINPPLRTTLLHWHNNIHIYLYFMLKRITEIDECRVVTFIGIIIWTFRILQL